MRSAGTTKLGKGQGRTWVLGPSLRGGADMCREGEEIQFNLLIWVNICLIV